MWFLLVSRLVCLFARLFVLLLCFFMSFASRLFLWFGVVWFVSFGFTLVALFWLARLLCFAFCSFHFCSVLFFISVVIVGYDSFFSFRCVSSLFCCACFVLFIHATLRYVPLRFSLRLYFYCSSFQSVLLFVA